MACNQNSFINCNGEPIAPTLDADGNEVIQLCPVRIPPKFTDWNSITDVDADGNPVISVDCCSTESDDGNFAVDEVAGCVSHICRDGAWLPLCGGTTTRPDQRVCYDLSSWTFPATYGGGQGSWVVNGVNLLADSDCPLIPTPVFPSMVESTCDWSVSALGNSPETWVGTNWNDTGQGAGAGTLIEATGDPADGWACTRPSYRINMGIAAGAGTGPYSVEFELQDSGGAINAALYDSCSDTYLPITSFSTSPVCGSAYVATGTLGDILAINSGTCVVPNRVKIDFADPNSVDASCLYLIFTAMGNYPQGGTPELNNERVNDAQLIYTPTNATTGDCCIELTSPAAVANLLTSIDPAGAVWSVEGQSVCTNVGPGAAAIYDELTSCDDSQVPTVIDVVE